MRQTQNLKMKWQKKMHNIVSSGVVCYQNMKHLHTNNTKLEKKANQKIVKLFVKSFKVNHPQNNVIQMYTSKMLTFGFEIIRLSNVYWG